VLPGTGDTNGYNGAPDLPRPPFSVPTRLSEHHSWKVFEAWVKQHPDIVRQYGKPREAKFVSVHEQNFATGYVAYNVTDDWSVWLTNSPREFKKRGNPLKHLTPGSGREIDEDVFREVTSGMTPDEKTIYRSLVEARVKSHDFSGVGIIGGIGTLYIRDRLLSSFGQAKENEYLVEDLVYASADGYELLAGLRHGLGGTTPDSPKSVYVLYRDGHYDRHVQFPKPFQG
jgi:hypothetical protein